jgi:ribosomal protein S18 acetylase RimI-like enzyme
MPTPAIMSASTPADMAAAAALFRDYAASLPVDLAMQGFAEELASLPGVYAPPHGALLLAKDGETVLGCIALKPLAPGVAEIKRLYVKPEARGLKLGAALIAAIIQEAQRLEYRELKLDTLPHLQAAIALYRRAGFEAIALYGSHEYPGLICLGKTLPNTAK